jgi:hypothetical protein
VVRARLGHLGTSDVEETPQEFLLCDEADTDTLKLRAVGADPRTRGTFGAAPLSPSYGLAAGVWPVGTGTVAAEVSLSDSLAAGVSPAGAPERETQDGCRGGVTH